MRAVRRAFGYCSFEKGGFLRAFREQPTLTLLYEGNNWGLLFDKMVGLKTQAEGEGAEYCTLLQGFADVCIQMEQWKSAEQALGRVIELLGDNMASRGELMQAYFNWTSLFLQIEVDRAVLLAEGLLQGEESLLSEEIFRLQALLGSAYYLQGDHLRARPLLHKVRTAEDGLTRGLALNALGMMQWFAYRPSYPETPHMQTLRLAEEELSSAAILKEGFLEVPTLLLDSLRALENNPHLQTLLLEVAKGEVSSPEQIETLSQLKRGESRTVLLNLLEYWMRFSRQAQPGLAPLFFALSESEGAEGCRALYLAGTISSQLRTPLAEAALRKAPTLLGGRTCYEGAEALKYLALYLDSDPDQHRGAEVEELVNKAKQSLATLPYWAARGVHLPALPLIY